MTTSKMKYVMDSREIKVHNTLKAIWYDVSEVMEITQDVFHATIPRAHIEMNNLIQLMGQLVWHQPHISLTFLDAEHIRIELNFLNFLAYE